MDAQSSSTPTVHVVLAKDFHRPEPHSAVGVFWQRYVFPFYWEGSAAQKINSLKVAVVILSDCTLNPDMAPDQPTTLPWLPHPENGKSLTYINSEEYTVIHSAILENSPVSRNMKCHIFHS